jgi:cyclase
MVKKRLIFNLYYFKGSFYLSRNFTLQRVGDVNWLIDKFKFKKIGDIIDELVIFNVDRNRPSIFDDKFYSDMEKLLQNVFVPLAIGGGVSSELEIDKCFRFGCDKLVFSSAFIYDINLLEYTRNRYGNQALVINVDYKIENGIRNVYLNNGSAKYLSLEDYLIKINSFGPGELILNCISLDGTGLGFDSGILEFIKHFNLPIIIAGGAGKPEHFYQIMNDPKISAGATGNLFNFLGNGFFKVREYLINQGLNVRRIS